jgi:hypothetical protein
MTALTWSSPVPFEQDAVRKLIPATPGVYQILQDPPYSRYEGKTDIVKIGKSDGSIQFEVLNHFVRHTCSNRLERIRRRPGVRISVVWVRSSDPAAVESLLLREFEDRYQGLPVLNSQRGYARDTDKHYRG